MRRTLTVNGQEHGIEAPGLTSLAEVLRAQLGLTGTKVACGRGECGACTVLVGGVPQLACVLPAAVVTEEVATIEGVAEEIGDLRAEFADRGAFQCGFCTPGQLVHGTALLRRLAGGGPGGCPGRAATSEEVRRQMSGNICRCTGYQAIVAAVETVARRRHEDLGTTQVQP